jgi:integral membrane protein
MVMGIVKAVRWTAYVEATLFILLLIAVVIQATGHGSLPAAIVGSMHGTVFTFYILLVLVARFKVKWRWRTTAAILLIACVPGGGYVVDRYAFKYEPRAKRPTSGSDAGSEPGPGAGAGAGRDGDGSVAVSGPGSVGAGSVPQPAAGPGAEQETSGQRAADQS